jgi:hypothetical protein
MRQFSYRKRTTMKSILDPSFKYVSSFATDLRKTFARVRRDHRRDERLKQRKEKVAALRAVGDARL